MTTPQRKNDEARGGAAISNSDDTLHSSFTSDSHVERSKGEKRQDHGESVQPDASTIFHLNGQRGLQKQKTAFFEINQPERKKQPLQSSSRANKPPVQVEQHQEGNQQNSVKRIRGEEEVKVFKVKKKVKVAVPNQKQATTVRHEGGQQPQTRQSRPTSAIQRDHTGQTMGQHLCQEDATFGTVMMERYRSDYHIQSFQDGVQKSLAERPQKLAESTKSRTQEQKLALYKNKSVTFGEDGTSGSAFMIKQTSQSFGASPTIVSSQSPKLKLQAQSQHHYKHQLQLVADKANEKVIADENTVQPKDSGTKKKQSHNQHAEQEQKSRLKQSLHQEINSYNLPASSKQQLPLMTRLTFCQLTNDSLNAQCQETSFNRGSRTPNIQLKKKGQMLSQSDPLMLSMQPQAIVKASSEINNSRQYYTKKKGSGAKNSRNGSTKTFTSEYAPHSTNIIQTGKLGRRDYLPLQLPQDDNIQEVISAMGNDESSEEVFFNSRSASYLAVQSQMREVQGMGVDPESQSYYDHFLSQQQENNSSWTKMEDGTPKNALSTQKQAIRYNKKQSHQHNTQKRSNVSSNKSHQSIANVSEQKPRGQVLGFNNFRKMNTNEQMNEVNVSNRKHSLSNLRGGGASVIDDTSMQPVQGQQPHIIAMNDSQMHRVRPPLGPNSAKKGTSVFWSGGGPPSQQPQSRTSGFAKHNINRTLTVNGNFETRQVQKLRQKGGLGDSIKANRDSQYLKLKTQVGRSQHNSWQVQDAAFKSSQIVNHLSNQTMSNQLKQLSSNRSGTSSDPPAGGPSQLASSSEKQDLGLNNPLIKVYKVRTITGHHQSPPRLAQQTTPSSGTIRPSHQHFYGSRSKNKSSKNLSQQSMRTLQDFNVAKATRVGQGTSMVTLPQSSFISHNNSVSGSCTGGLHDSVKTIDGMKTNATQRIASNNLSHLAITPANISTTALVASKRRQIGSDQQHMQRLNKTKSDLSSSARVSYFNAAQAATKNAGTLSVKQRKNSLIWPGSSLCLTSSTMTVPQAQQSALLSVPTGQQQLQQTVDVQGQLQEAKRLFNKMKDKNKNLKSRIGYLTKEVADRDKLMQKFVLNNETEVKLKESCLLQSYKSKLAEVERRQESLKKKNATLTAEKAELIKQHEVFLSKDELLKGQLQQLRAEKEHLHNEFVQMSQRIYIEQHERRRQMLADENTAQPQAAFLVPVQNAASPQRNNSIINIETVRQQPNSTSPQRPRTAVLSPSRGYQPILPVTVISEPEAENTSFSPERRVNRHSQQQQEANESPMRVRELWTPELLAQINQHKILEQQYTVDQFNHIKDCSICTAEGDMCDQARQDYPNVDLQNLDAWRPPIEFMLLNDSQNFEEQRSIYLKVIRDMRVEQHKLGLMLLQEIHDRWQQMQNQKNLSEKNQSEEELQTEDTREMKAQKTTIYLEQLRQLIIEQESTILEFKREIQRLYAPKVKIILQLRTLQDEAAWRATSQDPRANVERAKACLQDVFHLSDKVFDDSFFKTFMRNFEPVFSSETAKMTQKVVDALRKAQSRRIKKLGVNERDAISLGDKLSSVHRVVSIEDLESADPKLLQFARYLAHQTLKSEENLSIEIIAGGQDPGSLATSFQLSECIKHMATQYSTQESEWIDETHTNSLMLKLYDSKALNVFFSTMKANTRPIGSSSAQPMLMDCITFRNMLGQFSQSIEEDRAADQLLNSLKVRTLCTHMVDLGDLHRILTTESLADDHLGADLASHEISDPAVGRKPKQSTRTTKGRE